MLRVDTRELRKGPVSTDGVVPADDPLLEGLDVSLAEPLRVSGGLEATSQGNYLWRGRFEGRAVVACRRCLTELTVPISASVEALFSSDPDLQDDPNAYPLPDNPAEVDVAAAVREELVFASPAYPLCREDCAGLCPKCGADLNLGPCGCGTP